MPICWSPRCDGIGNKQISLPPVIHPRILNLFPVPVSPSVYNTPPLFISFLISTRRRRAVQFSRARHLSIDEIEAPFGATGSGSPFLCLYTCSSSSSKQPIHLFAQTSIYNQIVWFSFCSQYSSSALSPGPYLGSPYLLSVGHFNLMLHHCGLELLPEFNVVCRRTSCWWWRLFVRPRPASQTKWVRRAISRAACLLLGCTDSRIYHR